MLESKLIKPSDLNSSNRKLLTVAQQVGLSSDEIIRKSLQAAYGGLLKPGRARGPSVAPSKNHNHAPVSSGLKPPGKQPAPPPKTRVDGIPGVRAARQTRK
jgi:hypothetical protein